MPTKIRHQKSIDTLKRQSVLEMQEVIRLRETRPNLIGRFQVIRQGFTFTELPKWGQSIITGYQDGLFRAVALRCHVAYLVRSVNNPQEPRWESPENLPTLAIRQAEGKALVWTDDPQKVYQRLE